MRRALGKFLRGLANKLAPLRIPDDQLAFVVNAAFCDARCIVVAEPKQVQNLDPALMQRVDQVVELED